MRSSPPVLASASRFLSSSSRLVSSAVVVERRKRNRLFCWPRRRRKPYSRRSSAGVQASVVPSTLVGRVALARSEEHTSELQSLAYLVCRLLLEKKKK